MKKTRVHKYKKYNIVYITTNLINRKQYVGDHSTDNLNDKYLGSGKLIGKAIKKYGKENFTREILEECRTKSAAFQLQEKYIKKFNTQVPNGYNLNKSGGSYPSIFGDEDRLKEYLENINNSRYFPDFNRTYSYTLNR